ncbi:MAG: hypothetical protein AMJ65_07190 [Phycisphaerae bacterium SG8_4]|nr:MAG: hypothetical protein AMJ65_07190 [Phycisphaerae bacterium SG8_4]
MSMEDTQPQPAGDDGGVNPPQPQKLPTPHQMHSLMHMLVGLLNGITISEKALDEYDSESKINITYDEEAKSWSMWTGKKDDAPKIITPGLVKPKRKRRRIQLPSSGDRRRMFGS